MTVDAPPATTRRDLPADPMLPRPFQVIGTHLDTRDTVTLALEPLDGAPLVHRAGQTTIRHHPAIPLPPLGELICYLGP